MKNYKKVNDEKLSISECKKILGTKGKEYSENEIISIRDLLYCFAQVDIDTYYHIKEKENKQIQKSNSIQGNNFKDAA